MSYYGPSHSSPRVPPGLTAEAIADAIRFHFNDSSVKVQLVPANPIFRYGGVQHAALITMATKKEEEAEKVVYDLEAQAFFTLQKMNQDSEKEKQRMWRWALRGIVIQ